MGLVAGAGGVILLAFSSTLTDFPPAADHRFLLYLFPIKSPVLLPESF